MSKIFVSYTGRDRAWAHWIGVTLRDNGHQPFVHEWEIGAGQNIPRWMDERIAEADCLLGVFSDAYTKALYSSAERWAAYWQDPAGRDGFLVPVEVETVTSWPPLVRPLNRLSLVGKNESEAEEALLNFLKPRGAPEDRPPFPPNVRSPFPGARSDQERSGGPQPVGQSIAAPFGRQSESLPTMRPVLPATRGHSKTDDGRNAAGGSPTHPNLPDPKNREEMSVWLRDKPKSWAVVLAARAALRVLPLIGRATPAIEVAKNVIQAVFRATAVSRFFAMYPNRDIADAASAAFAFASSTTSAAFATSAGFGAASDASAAYAAAAATFASSASSADASTAYVAAANGATSYAYEAYDVATSAASYSAASYSAIDSDVELLSAAITPKSLARAPLWRGGQSEISTIVADQWADLSRDLMRHDSNWSVWIDWYESVLVGALHSEAWETAFTDVPGSLYWNEPLPWETGPEAVNAAIKRRLAFVRDAEAAVRADALSPPPSTEASPLLAVGGVHAPLKFGWSASQTITVVSGPANLPVLPLPSSERDHIQRLEACLIKARDIAQKLAGKRYNVRGEYLEALRNYANRLPTVPGNGNILLADAEARLLRQFFADEAAVLPQTFAALLKTFLEQHIGLRVYYPEIARFYADVKSGIIETPLPLDAADAFMQSVRAHTPDIFDPSVGSDVAEVEAASALAPAAPAPQQASAQQPSPDTLTTPPPDPLGELDPAKAYAYSIAGVINELWKTFSSGEKLVKNAKAWSEANAALGQHVGPVLDWLRDFLQRGGDGTPPPSP